jgi:predicted nucleic acid-binding protein
MVVYLDTGGLIALNDRGDRNHGGGAAYFRRALREGTRFVVGRPVLVEYLDGVTKRISKADAVLRLRQIEGSSAWRVEPDREEDHVRARELFLRYDDQDIDLTDSLSFAIMERLALTLVFTFDRDFEVHGFTRVPSRNRAAG